MEEGSILYFLAKAIIRPGIGEAWNSMLRTDVVCSNNMARIASGEKTNVCATPLIAELTPTTGLRL